MKAVFEHIEQTRYLLSHLFESGFSSGRTIAPELDKAEQTAAELGLSGGAELIRELSGKLTAFAAAQIPFNNVVTTFSNLVLYYNMVLDMLIAETMSTKKET